MSPSLILPSYASYQNVHESLPHLLQRLDNVPTPHNQMMGILLDACKYRADHDSSHKAKVEGLILFRGFHNMDGFSAQPLKPIVTFEDLLVALAKNLEGRIAVGRPDTREKVYFNMNYFVLEFGAIRHMQAFQDLCLTYLEKPLGKVVRSENGRIYLFVDNVEEPEILRLATEEFEEALNEVYGPSEGDNEVA
ncbi:uncharacterized protein BDZ99DRAFT_557528 [Mytilinidion resinicola]|uniref:Uncharacterized protein n=1 Tax=Mytilinidion resinicola TaxID=574789 RepID=A0A6A6Z096_9PEZI|nr:uncharacterized protein BDZ99DRAFT_557528 [Mytilinidion resinicola]KAF2813605.1 hypothetical protein BDZ99DRAFT_557528 [Mytilinidion resinicola]